MGQSCPQTQHCSRIYQNEIRIKADKVIETELKPRFVKTAPENSDWNYVTDITGKWHGRFFYLIATYACPGANAISPFFESRFARFEHIGNGKFALAFLRHTGTWHGLYHDLTIDECFESVLNDPWFCNL
jgi:hypothetical protein